MVFFALAIDSAYLMSKWWRHCSKPPRA